MNSDPTPPLPPVLPGHLPTLPEGTRYGGRLRDYDGTIKGHTFDEERNKWTGLWSWNGMKNDPSSYTGEYHIAIPIALANGIGGEQEKPIIIMTAGGVSEYRSHPDLEDNNGITTADYEEVLESHRALVREIDTILFGENAAKQASLCDLVGPIRKFKEELAQANAAVVALRELVEHSLKEQMSLRPEFRDKWFVEAAEDALEGTPPAPDGWSQNQFDKSFREHVDAAIKVGEIDPETDVDYILGLIRSIGLPKPPTGKEGGDV